MEHLSGFTAEQIVGLLEKKHKEDIFVSECKNGPTFTSDHLRKLDGWALLKTYSPVTSIGYEVKVSRHDFEQDQKWVDYLAFCHMFYFVCPSGLIRSTDLPGSVGLIWVSSTGHLHYKRRALRNTPEGEKWNQLLLYVLMSRSRIVEPNHRDAEEIGRVERVRRMVEEANERKKLAYFVKGHIQDVARRQEEKEHDLSQREDSVRQFAKQLDLLGISWDATKHEWHDTYRVQREIAALRKGMDEGTIRMMRDCAQRLKDTADVVERQQEPSHGIPR